MTRRRDATLVDFFHEQAAVRPDAVAIESGAEQLSYGTLHRRAAALARYLREDGVAADVIVGVALERSIQAVVTFLAILEAGGAYLPLELRYPRARLRRMLDHARVSLVVTRTGHADLFDDVPVRTLCVDAWRPAPSADGPGESLRPHRDQLANVMYTSGSTGAQKGVAVTHANVAHLVADPEYVPLTPRSRVLHTSLLGFDASTFEIWGALVNGGRLVVYQPAVPDPPDLAQLIERSGVTIAYFASGLFQKMVDLQFAAVRRLEHLLAGADVLSVPHARRLAAAGTHVINVYGPTEITGWASVHPIDAQVTAPAPIGLPIAGASIEVLDEGLEPVAPKERGELCVAGGGVARGYLNAPALTAAHFVPSPSGPPGARMYRTGDIGRWGAHGRLEFIGRRDDQIKLRGFRIQLAEIEGALREHPAVASCAIVRRDTAEGDSQLVAYVMPHPGARVPAPVAIRAFLNRTLPDYMLPATIVAVDAWPLTPTGKLDRKALPPPAPATDAAYAPSTPDEELLCDLFAQALNRNRIAPDDDFFELGGHSLLAMQLASRIRSVLAVDLSLRTLLDARSVRRLAPVLRGQTTPPPPVFARERPRHLPASSPQRRLWLAAQQEQAARPYNLPYALAIRGPLDVGVLDRALRALLDRHQILRTRFNDVGGEPMQVVDVTCVSALAIQDVSADARPLPDIVHAAAVEDGRERFDLGRAPLLRLRLLRFAPDHHVLLGTFHHIIWDGWSETVFARDLLRLYASLVERDAPPLPPLAVQYADYAIWHQEWAGGGRIADGLRYWTARLAGATRLDLPTDRPPPPAQRLAAGAVIRKVAPARVSAWRAFGLAHGTTLYMTLLAGVAALLARYSGQRDVVIGSASTNRPDAAFEDLIGFFVNSLPIRVAADGELAVRDLLAAVRRHVLDAFEHQDVPFDRIVEAVAPDRTPGATPLYQVAFELQHERPPLDVCPMLRVETIPLWSDYITCDLEVHAVERRDGLELRWAFDRDLFDAWRIEQMARHFELLLDGFLEADGRTLRELPMLTVAERQQLLSTWIAIDSTLGRDTLPAMFEAEAARRGDGVAVVQGDRAVTYDALNARADRIAAAFEHRGTTAHGFVAVLLPRSCEWIEAVLGVLKAGCAYGPLDPGWPAARITAIVEEIQPVAVITDDRLRALLPAAVTVMRTELLEGPQRQRRPLAPECPAYVIYTSGSTGSPKGVMVTHAGISAMRAAHVTSLGVHARAIVLQFASAAFDASIWELVMGLGSGATLVIADDASRSGQALARLVARHSVTHVTLPALVLGTIERDALRSVQTLVVAGDAVSADQLSAWIPGRRVINAYGPTEATVCATMSAPLVVGERPPIGRPLVNVSAYVLGGDLELVPVGVPGELYVAGSSLALGYIDRPGLTASRFVANPYGPSGSRLYRTGDVARWRPDGQLEFVGRTDRQCKVRGFRVELEEIEAALRGEESLAQAAVMVRHDEPAIERLVGYVVPACGSRLDREALLASLARRLPDYMIPRTFVELPSLPLGRTGKVDWAALPPPLPASCEAPASPAEQALASVWQEVLHCGPVGRDANFFELGGDSITSIHVVARARRAGWMFEVWDVFQNPVLSALAAVALPMDAHPVATAPVPWSGPVAPTPIQRWFWMGDRTSVDHYNQTLMLVATAVDCRRLMRAVDGLANQHDMLRMHWSADGGEQWVSAQERGRRVTSVDLRLLTPHDQTPVMAAIERSVQGSLDLRDGPVFRAVHVRLADDIDGERLLLVVHHLAVDWVSWRILLEDLARLYEHATDSPPAAGASFGQWAAALSTFKPSPSARRFWLRQIEGAHAARLWRADTDRANTVGRCVCRTVSLDEASSAALLSLPCAEWPVAPQDVLVFAVVGALAELTGRTRLLIHLEGHGRSGVVQGLDVSRTVGWLTTLYPVLIGVPLSGAIESRVLAVSRSLAAVPDGGLSYGLLAYGGTEGAAFEPAPAEILVNYLGRAESVLPPQSMFSRVEPSSGPAIAPERLRPHVLEFEALARDGVFSVSCTYDDSRVPSRAAVRLTTRLRALLQQAADAASVAAVPTRAGAASGHTA